MGRTKLKKLQKLDELPNVFSYKNADRFSAIKNYFAHQKLFTLEIGCGHGDYSVELAKEFPHRNFIGIDVKGARIFRGATRAIEMNLKNAAFLITKAERITEIFDPKSIEEIYIPFPDPHVKLSNQNRRLVSPKFLNIYKELIVDSARIHFKTDNKSLFQYAIENIHNADMKILYLSEDLHNGEAKEFNPGILTSYEKHYLKEGRTIKYVCFRF